jgi:hypothetical protein
MKSITFNDLLTDPKYREMTVRQIEHEIRSKMVRQDYPKEWRYCFNVGEPLTPFAEYVFNHLQKLKAESETKKVFCTMRDGTKVELKPNSPMTITDQYARETLAKIWNVKPEDIKIV